LDYAIKLTTEEEALLDKIELEPKQLDYARCKAQEEPILLLLKSLTGRNAIPAPRVSYWTNPTYRVGHGTASHKAIFEANGRRGEAIYTHPPFLPFLYYFLFGAKLQPSAITAFEELVGNAQWVTSGDMAKITRGARKIARECNLKQLEEEFDRLALDIGLEQHRARSVRDAVVRSR
jgi:hypothetical protein